MNKEIINGEIFYYESFWKLDKNEEKKDAEMTDYPFPSQRKKKYDNEMIEQFIKKLETIQNILKDRDKSFRKTTHYKNCLLNDNHINISNGTYILYNIVWDDSLIHYIKEHNVLPSNEFLQMIDNSKIYPNKILIKKQYERNVLKLKTHMLVKENARYIKITENQLNILDALYEHGGNKERYYDKFDKLRFSEHAGDLDFHKDKLEKIIVSATSTRMDEDDTEIFFPDDLYVHYDYEYMFHTHPFTPSRFKDGIIYEVPSTSDIMHFIEHFNEGISQGSMVVCPEGIYIITYYQITPDSKILIKDEDKFENECNNVISKIHNKLYGKHKEDYLKNELDSVYNETEQVIMMNEFLNKYNLTILYYPRIHKNGMWKLREFYLKVYSLEFLS